MIKHSKYPSNQNESSLRNWATTQRRLYIRGENRFAALLEQLPWWQEYIEEENSSVKNKKLLLAMAKNGEPRPAQNRKHTLGYVFYNYTDKNARQYDPVFDKEIRILRPDWFVTQFDVCQDKKNQLLAMANNGEPRPNYKHPLWISFYKYTYSTRKIRTSYDPVFDKEIRTLRPDWFVNYCQDKKNKLLEMAKNGEPRPICRKHPLGYVFFNYTNKQNDTYDPVFDEQIRTLRPDWFVNYCQDKKNKLLEMAKNGEPRPICRKHPLAYVLSKYTNKNKMYDPIFDTQIRKLAPHWFK